MNKRLMVIEDNPDLLDIYQVCLKKDGFEVLCAENGEDALKKFLHFRPQVILCDVKMPHLSGFDFIEIINSYPKLREKTAVFIMSAYDDEKMVRRAEELGISRDRYLVKSQTAVEQLLETIKAAVA